jgi:hypothetical protein
MSETTYEYAKLYVNVLGFSVIPIALDSKKPAIEWKEYQQRKPTEEELKKWFLENNYNIGIVTGAISRIVVVDLDSKEAIAFAVKNHFSQTPTVETGKGFHLYFKYQDGVRNFQKRPELKDIDLRANGGYVLAPPSIHPETKKPYEWKLLPGKVDYAELPEILLQKPQQKSQLAQLYKGVPEGERNNTLTRLVGSWVSDGLSYEECLENALLWNSKNDPPLPEKEVERTVKSIFEKHRRIDILPDVFEIVEEPFGYEMFHPQYKLYFFVKNPHQDREGIKCYLEIKCEDQRATAKDLYSANFNFHSGLATKQLATVLKNTLPFVADTTQLVESFKKEFKKKYTTIQAKKVSEIQADLEPEFLYEPYILKNSVNLIYGLGATGKSIMACYLAIQLSKMGYRVLYLDYENVDEIPITRTINKIDSTNIENIYVRACHASLQTEIEQLYREVKDKKIDLVIIDSVIKSIASDVFDPERVSQYFLLLSKIPTTWLLISHVAKNAPERDPFGSVFFFNLARNIWFAKRLPDSGELIIQLVHRKSNFTKLYPPAVYYIREKDDKTFEVNVKDIAGADTITEMIILSLYESPKTLSQLQKALPTIDYKKLSVYLDRLKKRNKVKNENGSWMIVEEESPV